jgi:hypothetical protein
MNTVTKKATEKKVSTKEITTKRAENKAKNNAKRTKSKSGVLINKPVIYLKEGVTGAQLRTSQRDSNNAHKENLADFKTALKRAKEFDKGYITAFKLTRKEMTEAKLKTFLTPNEVTRQANNVTKLGYERYTVWGVQQLIRRMAKAKHATVK